MITGVDAKRDFNERLYGEFARIIKARLAELPVDREYVAYCRDPYCVYADEAVAVLRAKGRAARRLTDGYPEWSLAGRPVGQT